MSKCVQCGGPASWRLWKLGSDADADMGAYCEGDLDSEVKVTCSPWYATPIDDTEAGS